MDSRLVLEIVRDSDCSAYDCEFVAFAKSLGIKLVTEDKKLLKAFPAHALALSAGQGRHGETRTSFEHSTPLDKFATPASTHQL